MTIRQSRESNVQYGNYVGRVNRICEDFRIDSLQPQISALDETLQQNDVINVALVGGFKAGKSSFLNSLVGRDVLPAAVLPLTSVVTYVKYGIEDKAKVRLLSGQDKDIALHELPDFITEERNPENAKRVDRVDVELSNLQEYKGIRFVDTPGFGSAYKHNTLTSTGWLPKVGAAFLAVSVAHPFSEADILLLKELATYTSEIVVLITKIDLVSSIEVNEVTQFIHNQVVKQLGKDVQILPFSNRPGFEVPRQSVYEFIRKNISGDQARKSREIINHKFRSVLSKCREYLLLALSSAGSAQESRQQLSHLLAQERQRLPVVQKEIQLMGANLKVRVQSDSSRSFQDKYQFVKDQLVGELREQMPLWKGNLAKTSEDFRKWAETNLIKHLEMVSEENGLNLSEHHLRPALDSFSRIVRAFQDRMAHDIENALHAKFSGAAFEAQIEKPQRTDVQVGNVFMTSWEIVWFLIPMRIFRPMINRHFVKIIPWEVEKNLYRLAAQWYNAISGSIDNLAHQAEVFIHNEMNTVENILTKAPDQRKEIEKAISEIEIIGNTL